MGAYKTWSSYNPPPRGNQGRVSVNARSVPTARMRRHERTHASRNGRLAAALSCLFIAIRLERFVKAAGEEAAAAEV